MKSFYKLVFLAAVFFGASFSVHAQACGYSTTAFYLQDRDAAAVKHAVFKFVDAKGDHDEEHFNVVTNTFWDAKRNAYVSVHGLCGQHEVIVKISAQGFEAAEQKIRLPFGRQGFILKLKRKGTDDEVSLEKLSCATQDECPYYLRREVNRK